MAVFPPASPAMIPTMDAVYDGMVSVKPQFVFTPPIFIEVIGNILYGDFGAYTA